MGLFDFVKDAGEKIFGDDEPTKSVAGSTPAPDNAAADRAKGQALERLILGLQLNVDGLDIAYRDGMAKIRGAADSQATREKAVILVGNSQGVARVDDQMTVEAPEPEATLYTVKSGDSLSKISKAQYGDAMKYMKIFEANQPMLKDPDKIYPGQVLRIPPLDS